MPAAAKTRSADARAPLHSCSIAAVDTWLVVWFIVGIVSLMVLSIVFGHKKTLEDRVSGLTHMAFIYGFLILGIGHTEGRRELLQRDHHGDTSHRPANLREWAIRRPV